jgi:hypothetical protein
VSGGKASGVRYVDPLVAFSDILGRKRRLFYSASNSTRDNTFLGTGQPIRNTLLKQAPKIP